MKHKTETVVKRNHSRSLLTVCLIILLVGVLMLSSCGAAAEGDYDAAAIYDPTPYQTGMSSNDIGAKSYPYADKTFDYEKLYAPGEKRKPAGDKSTMDLAEEANSEDWTYTVPGSQGKMPGYYAIGTYDYYLIRGFAVIEAGGIGTYGSDTGVEGLKTIIPVAGISSWYDYANSQGVSTYSEPHYTDILAGLVAGATYLDVSW